MCSLVRVVSSVSSLVRVVSSVLLYVLSSGRCVHCGLNELNIHNHVCCSMSQNDSLPQFAQFNKAATLTVFTAHPVNFYEHIFSCALFLVCLDVVIINLNELSWCLVSCPFSEHPSDIFPVLL